MRSMPQPVVVGLPEKPKPDAKVVSVLSLGFATSQVAREELPTLGETIRKAAAALARLLAQEEHKDAA